MPSNHVFGRRYTQRGSHGVTGERWLQYNQSTMYTRVFQILGVFRKIDIPRPPNEPLIRPDQRIRVNLLALMSPDSECLSIVIQHPQQMNTVNDARLMKLSRDPEQLLELLLAEMIQHSRIHHVGGETLRVLAQTEIR